MSNTTKLDRIREAAEDLKANGFGVYVKEILTILNEPTVDQYTDILYTGVHEQ